MLFLEELVDAVIAEEGQVLMGLDFLMETLGLPMTKIDLIFKKALSEYSERRPMKKTTVIQAFDYADPDGSGYITMPEGTTSCRVARYGVLPNQMPRYYMPKFGEQNVEYDPTTQTCRVWPPVTPLRLTYTQRYTPTTSILIQDKIDLPYESDEASTTLKASFGGKSLEIQKTIVVKDFETGEFTSEILSMSPTGYVNEKRVDGETISEAVLAGTLGNGLVNLKTREMTLHLEDDSIAPIFISYYPKFSVVREMDLGDRLFTKLFAAKLLQALAGLRAQATQNKLHQIDLTTDDLLSRVAELKKEVREILRSSISFGDMAPM